MALLEDGRKSLEPYLKDTVVFKPHQVEGVRRLANVKSLILADDMGLGKTLEALALFCVDVKRGTATHALVVAPVSLKENWEDEIQKFTTLRYVVLDSKLKPALRLKIIQDFKADPSPGVLVVNYEQVRAAGHLTALNVKRPGKKFAWDFAIFDEAHYIKNPTSARTKACLRINALRNLMLTGTPLLNNVNELWALLNKIDPLKWNNYYQFINRFCVFGGYQDKAIIGTKNTKELQDALDSIMLRRLAKDVLDLKAVETITRFVTLTPEQRELYDKTEDELVIVNKESGEEEDIDNALVKFLRLKQICGTTLDFTGEDHSAKFDRAIEDSKQIAGAGNKQIIFSQFLSVQKAYVQRLQAEGIPTWIINGSVPAGDRQGVVKDWSTDPRPGAIVCGLQVANVGLNMIAGSYVLFMDKSYVPGQNDQAIARAHRLGQTKPVIVIEYLAKDTVESRIETLLAGKRKTFTTVIENDDSWTRVVKNAMKEVLKK